MATTQNLVVNVLGNASQLSRTAKRAQADVQRMGERVTGSVRSIVASFAGLAGIGGAGFGIGIGVQMAGEMEQAQISFEVLIGSAERARKTLSDLQQFAAATPFQQPELIAAGQSLLAFNTQAERVVPTLRMVGDVAAGINQPIGEIAEIFGKAKVQGRLFMEDINQLTGRGIPIIQELAKQFGVTESEVRNLVSSGQVSFANLEQAFASLTAEGGKFHGMMERQSGSLLGLWSTFKDNLGMKLMEIGQQISEELDLKQVLASSTRALQSLSGSIASTVVTFAKWGKHAIAVGVAIGTVSAALRIVRAAQQSVIKAQILFQALSGPKGWAKLAAGVAIYAGTMYGINKLIGEGADKQAQFNQQAGEVGGAARQATAAAQQFASAIDGANGSLSAGATALDRYKSDVEKLQESLAQIKQASVQMQLQTSDPNERWEIEQRSQAAQRQAIDQSTGVFSQIKSVQDELARLRGEATDTDQKLRDMLAGGAPPEAVESLRQLIAQREKLQAMAEQEEQARQDSLDLDRRAQQIKDQMRTPQEEYRQQAELIRLLGLSGRLTRQEQARALARARERLQSATQRDEQPSQDRAPGTNRALDVRSAAGAEAIARLFHNTAETPGSVPEQQRDILERIRQLQQRYLSLQQQQQRPIHLG